MGRKLFKKVGVEMLCMKLRSQEQSITNSFVIMFSWLGSFFREPTVVDLMVINEDHNAISASIKLSQPIDLDQPEPVSKDKIHQCYQHYYTPLCYAAHQGWGNHVKELLEAGANPTTSCIWYYVNVNALELAVQDPLALTPNHTIAIKSLLLPELITEEACKKLNMIKNIHDLFENEYRELCSTNEKPVENSYNNIHVTVVATAEDYYNCAAL